LKITNELGDKIIQAIVSYVALEINIIDLQGEIVSSTDKDRVNTKHAGAIEVIRTKDVLTITKDNIGSYIGAKEGVNMPIVHENNILGVVGVSGNPESLYKMSGLVKATVELVLDQIDSQQKLYEQDRKLHYWLQQLLHPKGIEEHSLSMELQNILMINPNAKWRVIILTGETLQEKVTEINSLFKRLEVEPLFVLAYITEEIIIALEENVMDIDVITKELLKMINEESRIGVGELYKGLNGIRESYHEAKRALYLSEGMEVVTFSRDWKLSQLIHSIDHATFHKICTPYEEKFALLDEEDKKTMELYFSSNLSIKDTANKLHIHRNTLNYRLNKITKRTGLDFRNFYDVMMAAIVSLYKK